jgi:hypothetical protein
MRLLSKPRIGAGWRPALCACLCVLPLMAATTAADGKPRRGDGAAPTQQAIASAQRALHGLGLYNGSANGTMGPQTRKAVADFQEASKLPATGALDRTTLFALANPASVKACLEVESPTAQCLEAADRISAFLADSPPPKPEAKDACGDAPAAGPCRDAVSQMSDWLNAHPEAASGSSSAR